MERVWITDLHASTKDRKAKENPLGHQGNEYTKKAKKTKEIYMSERSVDI